MSGVLPPVIIYFLGIPLNRSFKNQNSWGKKLVFEWPIRGYSKKNKITRGK